MFPPVPRPRRRQKTHLEPLARLLSQPDAGTRGLPIPPHAWWQAVGPRIAERARPMRLMRGELMVLVASATWAQELSFLAPTIMERLVALGFAVERLRFQVGRIDPAVRRPQPAPPRFVPPPAELSTRLAKSIEAVENEALRLAIFRAASANLAWQKQKEQPANAATRAVPILRFVGPGTVPQGRTTPQAPAAFPRKP